MTDPKRCVDCDTPITRKSVRCQRCAGSLVAARSDGKQQRAALVGANESRLAMASIKRDLRSRPYPDSLTHLANLIESGDAVTGRLRLAQALRACPRFGAARVPMVVRHIGAVTADRRIEELTERQRELLVVVLRSPGVLWPQARKAS